MSKLLLSSFRLPSIVYIYKNVLLKKYIFSLDRISNTNSINLFFLLPTLPILSFVFTKKFIYFFCEYTNMFVPKRYIGTYIAVVRNILTSFFYSHRKSFKLLGLGYKAYLINAVLQLKLGYSHSIFFKLPLFSLFILRKNVYFTFIGLFINELNNIAGHLAQLKFPDSYKGKGIFVTYSSLLYLRKSAKKRK